MNDPWNRFALSPSTTSLFVGDLASSAIQPVPNGGILGNFGQDAQTPPMGPRPAMAGSAALPPSGSPLWTQTWPFSSTLQTPDPDALRFHAAWRRLYSSPIPNPWLQSSFAQPSAQFGASAMSLPVSALGFTSATAAEAPRNVAPDPGRWPRPTTTIWDQPKDSVNTSSTAKYPDSADLREANDAQDGPPEILSDVTPDNLWIPGAEYAADGHHWFPRAIYRGKQALKDDDVMSPETRKVFDDAKSGRLHVYSINGMRHAYDAFGREYEAAVRDLLRDFMSENNIAKKSYLTPDHARAILAAIERSQDPRILAYNNVIRLMRLFPWLRGGGRE